MRLIPTVRKEKLPEGFSYPLEAEGISEAFDTVPHGEPVLRLYSVPSEYSSVAREHLLAELARVRRKLLAGGHAAKTGRITVTLSLSEAGATANPQGRASRRQPIRSRTNQMSGAP